MFFWMIFCAQIYDWIMRDMEKFLWMKILIMFYEFCMPHFMIKFKQIYITFFNQKQLWTFDEFFDLLKPQFYDPNLWNDFPPNS